MSDKMLDRSRVPIRRPMFDGVVKRTLDGSEPDWNFVAPIPAPDGAPNVLLVLTDDAGFGNPSRFGGPIRPPTMERLASRITSDPGFAFVGSEWSPSHTT